MNRKERSFISNVISTRMAVSSSNPKIPSYAYRGQKDRAPSLDTGIGNATLKESKVYTGDKMLGISAMHKSNAVPVFSKEEIIEIAHMRR